MRDMVVENEKGHQVRFVVDLPRLDGAEVKIRSRTVRHFSVEAANDGEAEDELGKDHSVWRDGVGVRAGPCHRVSLWLDRLRVYG